MVAGSDACSGAGGPCQARIIDNPRGTIHNPRLISTNLLYYTDLPHANLSTSTLVTRTKPIDSSKLSHQSRRYLRDPLVNPRDGQFAFFTESVLNQFCVGEGRFFRTSVAIRLAFAVETVPEDSFVPDYPRYLNQNNLIIFKTVSQRNVPTSFDIVSLELLFLIITSELFEMEL